MIIGSGFKPISSESISIKKVKIFFSLILEITQIEKLKQQISLL